MSGRTLVIGLGNPILGDDGVGWQVAEAVELCCRSQCDVDVERVALGGLSLMEMLEGYRSAVVVDAMHTGERPVGAVRRLRLEELADPTAGYSTAAHDTSLQTAICMGRTMGVDLPERITVVAVETAPQYEFSETLTPFVAAAVPQATAMVLEALGIRMSDQEPLQWEEQSHGVP